MEMRKMGASLWAFGLVILVGSAVLVHVITCSEATTKLIPCMPFLVGAGAATPTAACCSGVQAVSSAASSTQARRELCQCLIKAAQSKGVNPEKAKQLPGLCGVKLPVPFDPKVNCSSIP